MRLMVLDLARLNLCMSISSVGGENVHHTTDTQLFIIMLGFRYDAVNTLGVIDNIKAV